MGQASGAVRAYGNLPDSRTPEPNPVQGLQIHMVFGAAAGNGRLCLGSQGLLHGGGHTAVSKQHRLMQGPMAARYPPGRCRTPGHGIHRPGNPGCRPPPPGVSCSHRLADRVIKNKMGGAPAVKSSGSPLAHPSQGRPVPAPPGGTDPPPGFPGPPGHNIRMGLPGKHRLLGASPRPPPGSHVSKHPPGWSPR